MVQRNAGHKRFSKTEKCIGDVEKSSADSGYSARVVRPIVKHLHLASTDHAKTTAFYEAYFGFAFQKVFDRGAGQPSATIIRGPERFQIFLEAGATDLALPAWSTWRRRRRAPEVRPCSSPEGGRRRRRGPCAGRGR